MGVGAGARRNLGQFYCSRQSDAQHWSVEEEWVGQRGPGMHTQKGVQDSREAGHEARGERLAGQAADGTALFQAGEDLAVERRRVADVHGCEELPEAEVAVAQGVAPAE